MLCHDCFVNVVTIKEYYMVYDALWLSVAHQHEILCVGCLEHRLGRKLTKADFTDCILNTEMNHSKRLKERFLS